MPSASLFASVCRVDDGRKMWRVFILSSFPLGGVAITFCVTIYINFFSVALIVESAKAFRKAAVTKNVWSLHDDIQMIAFASWASIVVAHSLRCLVGELQKLVFHSKVPLQVNQSEFTESDRIRNHTFRNGPEKKTECFEQEEFQCLHEAKYEMNLRKKNRRKKLRWDHHRRTKFFFFLWKNVETDTHSRAPPALLAVRGKKKSRKREVETNTGKPRFSFRDLENCLPRLVPLHPPWVRVLRLLTLSRMSKKSRKPASKKNTKKRLRIFSNERSTISSTSAHNTIACAAREHIRRRILVGQKKNSHKFSNHLVMCRLAMWLRQCV